jgi:hypothetical protein
MEIITNFLQHFTPFLPSCRKKAYLDHHHINNWGEAVALTGFSLR